jgi:outer membrane lipoprotein
MRKLLVLLPTLLLFLAGCAHDFSDKSLALVDRTISFGTLRENPDAYRGKFVFLGGSVANVTPVPEGTLLEVAQYRLDSRGMPDQTAGTGGRFLATTPEFLDTATCKPGALVSMVGEVTGKKVQPLKGEAYTYPVIAVKELHFFKSDEDYFRTWSPYGP